VISLNSTLRADGSVGVARLRFRGSTIIGAEMVFTERNEITGGFGSDYRNTLLHEIGHVLGLAHSTDPRDVMYPGGYFNPGARLGQFTESESVALGMMYRYRSAGNFPPDRDPALGVRPSGSARPLRTTFVH
jgi:hypothetical protein